MNNLSQNCNIARTILSNAVEEIKRKGRRMNLIWLEATGCSGNIISILNSDNPDVVYIFENMLILTYNNSLMAEQGQEAFQKFKETLNTEFILVVEGAVSTKDNGLYTVVASDNGQLVTAADAVRMAAGKAKFVIAAGTCASYGGISAAAPNPSISVSVPEFLNRQVIRVPGCPSHPDWVSGTIAGIIAFGSVELDSSGRPLMFYGSTIHDRCTRRTYFDKGIFAEKLGDPQCMFKLGCRGPVTRTDCPVRQWNSYVNWPIEDNTPCIGCAAEGFPDRMEPFVRY